LIGNPIFMPLFWVALIGNFRSFFVAQELGDERQQPARLCRSLAAYT